jgi:hypothetical protein
MTRPVNEEAEISDQWGATRQNIFMCFLSIRKLLYSQSNETTKIKAININHTLILLKMVLNYINIKNIPFSSKSLL